ncbi:putative dehydrogenase/aryl-alcohol dehydrogenase-like putative oxidoreductase [Kaistia hirudinis]|uniref:Putative dehydrogenase/aryl-alcohol dehydrogenase-like putative oxidoreductase n=1 Tax=Kaistia hirudinis TaxID=1293440 RepID=A0A840APK9_9HYPH|nr:aldo/keto reductase [Kaistia hirudinis]MBB3930791.1 putative dehydrogenase/aryl-alcohol dehydrogenase-like putative oxidoreductase [Kaistia hirudinis]
MAESQNPVRWGIIGPGAIAKDFRRGVLDSRFGKLEAIATRNPGKAGLAEDFPEARILDGYDAILRDPDVDAIYIATPHVGHAEWAIKAAEAGKHVLVEKPFALSAFEADAVFHAHRKAGTFAAEAFMYRLHPQTKAIYDLVASGTIGEVRSIKSSFGFQMPGFMPDHRLFASALAGGGILDVGGYPVSMTRFIAGATVGKPFLDPVKVSGMANLNAEGTDNWASALLQFENGIIAEVSCAIMANLDNVLRIIGSEGRIEVPDFWFAAGDRSGGEGRIDIIKGGQTETIRTGKQRHLYSFEADAVAEAIFAGRQQLDSPGMSWADTLGNLRVLDKWRADAGIEFSVEKPAHRKLTLSGRLLKSGGTTVPRRRLAGIGKELSIVALGFEDFRTFASGAILLDAFYEAGGNLFDTGWVYGSGYTEKLLGEWLANRGVREQSVVIGKGAHTPLCYPDVIGKQLTQTLDRLQTDYLDIYFMHRDNPDVPVGEFVDAMDAEVKAGRIRGIFGGSNWTRERFDAAVAYAEKHGKQKPGALSNNFALAEMQDVIWPGCVSSSDDEWKAWFRDRQIPNFAWSSQGRGFFTDRAGRDKRDNEELVRVWYNERNFARRDRAVELAAKLGRSPIHVALAYVLAQPFPVVPLIGPRTLAELEDSLSALDIRLTPEQATWLDRG